MWNSDRSFPALVWAGRRGIVSLSTALFAALDVEIPWCRLQRVIEIMAVLPWHDMYLMYSFFTPYENIPTFRASFQWSESFCVDRRGVEKHGHGNYVGLVAPVSTRLPLPLCIKSPWES